MVLNKTLKANLALVSLALNAAPSLADQQHQIYAAPANTSPSPKIRKFKITEHGITLGQISQIFYGTTKFKKQICEWNNIQDPNKIRMGQTLILKNPTQNLSDSQVTHKITQSWFEILDRRDPHLGKFISRRLASLPPDPLLANLPPTPQHEELVQEVLAITPETPKKQVIQVEEKTIDAGVALAKAKDFHTARNLFKKARELSPTDPEPWLRELASIRAMGNHEEERSLALEISSKFPTIKELPFLKKFQDSSK